VMLVGFGTAGTAFATMVIASRGVADHHQGVIGGVINTSRQIGAAVGAALMPTVALAVSHAGPEASVSGDRAAMLTGAVAAGLATLVAWRRRNTQPAGAVPSQAVVPPTLTASRAEGPIATATT
jgi:sugar phosphate permease